ncbi:MAG: phosphatidate cytidylyltransferase [Gemmatimonadales bacterium]|jgi:phosphatidate cytidylyltransferase|nr:phosphatidate cytidylyltransferase [Gemmatimonadales bacterium]
MADRNMVQRVLFAVVAIPLALALVWFGGWPLVLLVTLVSVLGVREFYDLAARTGVRPLVLPGLAAAASLAPIVYGAVSGASWSRGLSEAWPFLAAAWFLSLLLGTLAARGPDQRPLGELAATVLGVVYAGALPTFLLAIRHGQHEQRSWAGTWLVFFPLIVIWVCDSAAMQGGRAIGGPKLWPSVSPGKTRSGALAGLLGGLLVAPLFAFAVFPRVGVPATLLHLLVIAGLLATLGQAGDLAESLFKREAGVKDSSALIPGHGGVLDRFDSLYVAIPLAAACYRLFGLA